MKKIKSKIIEKKSLAKNTKKFILSVPKNFEFKPGQYVLLELLIKNKISRRAYSISSAPNYDTKKNQIELCIKKIAKKGFVSELFKMRVGEKINFIGPIGVFFINKKPKKDLVFISTGTGIAPFKSIIENLLANLNFKKQITLIAGYRYEKDILYKSFFDNLEKKFSNFKQRIVLSKPENNNFLKGHVQNQIKELISNPKENLFYICGKKEMVSDVIKKLNSIGISNNEIFFEKYN